MSRLVFLDTETTGLNPGPHEAWEVALIVRAEDGTDTEHVFYVEPKHLERAEPAALRINRYYERTANMVAPLPRIPAPTHSNPRHTVPTGPGGPTWMNRERAARKIAGLTANATLVGLNVQFDARFLDILVRSGGQCPSWGYHQIDLRACTIGALHAAGHHTVHGDPVHDCKSPVLSEMTGVPAPPTDGGAHTALVDTRWVRDWYDAICGGAQ